MKNKGTKQKLKKKGSDNAFGCDLTEHLQNSGQDVPQVLKKCAEFIEEHGIVDGIYRLSGVTSNIQRLRQEFSSEACPDLTKEVYLQDIHCVGSLCKLYFRELPNPLLTFELYSKFTEVVSVQGEHERLLYIQKTIKELPSPHFRTLEYLTKHLAHLATLSTETNMHTRNLALVWAPNLLRSKNIETSCANGDMAFQEVRIQQSVVEFILNHRDQIFCGGSVQIKPKEGPSMCGEKYATLPISSQSGPMKLMSLEEAQARSLSPNHPVHRERQRENSLPDTSTATLYHTVIDIADSKRKLSGKSKKWKSIFNLGKSVDSKGKLSRNGSVFIRAQRITEKAALRPSRSMESLCSLTTDDDRTGNSPAGGPGSLFHPDVKSRTLGSDYDLSDHEQNWDLKGNKAGGATGGWSSGTNQQGSPGASMAPQKTLPEQLKVYKGDDLGGYKPTSPKNRRMLYSGSSHNSSSRPSFPGSFFPLESSPRHQRRAVNISEPFAVSVPLRVSAVISSNSTPCRGHAKDKAATLKAFRETSEPSSSSSSSSSSSNSGKSNTFPLLEPRRQEGPERKSTEELTSAAPPLDSGKDMTAEGQVATKTSALEPLSNAHAKESEGAAPSPGKQVHKQPKAFQLLRGFAAGKELWPDFQHQLRITEPEIDLLDETFIPVFGSRSASTGTKSTVDVKSKRSRSSPSLTLLCRDQSSDSTPLSNSLFATGSDSAKKQPSESDVSLSLNKNLLVGGSTGNICPADRADEKEKNRQKDEPADSEPSQPSSTEPPSETAVALVSETEAPTVEGAGHPEESPESPHGDKKATCDGAKRILIPEAEPVQRLSVCLEERPSTLALPHPDDDDRSGRNSEELDWVEPWDDLGSSKQWVTSPLHSPDVEQLFNQLSPFYPQAGASQEGETSPAPPPPQLENNKRSVGGSSERVAQSLPQTSGGKPESRLMYLPSVQAHAGKPKSSSHRFHRQMSYEAAAPEKREDHGFYKHRPCSLNLDLGYRCIRDISNQQSRSSLEFPPCQRGLLSSSGPLNNGQPSELELFLNDRQAPLRRNSAPVSVSSVRTAFMIKTCQAKAVPVIPPKVQYSQIPHSRHENDADPPKEKGNAAAAPPPVMSDLKEELENKEPASGGEKSAEAPTKTTSTPEPAVITRRRAPALDVFVDCPRPNRGNVLQRPSFRNRQRPQSLILLSPPFPIMDFPTSGDDGRLLSSLRGLNDPSATNAFSKDMAEGISLQNKMTIPKSGQRLETSTSCFYQPQRRSMIFDSRSHRQIE